MPVLSLPLLIPAQNPIWFPIRIPFPIMRIGSILPYSINGPFKTSLLALFKLAWSNKIQLPLLITVCFMAFDIRLQLEINIFWENNHQRQNGNRHQRAQRNNGGLNPEAVRAAVVTAALLHRQRQRQLLQERARQQELAGLLPGGRHNYPSILITEVTDDEASDSADENGESREQRGVTEAGLESRREREQKRKDKRNKSRITGGGGLQEEDDEDEEDTENEDNSGDDTDDNDSFRDDEDDDDSGASQNPEFFGDLDGDHFFDDHNGDRGGSEDDDSDDSDVGNPLVLELEIRQRPAFKALTTLLSNVAEKFLNSLVRNLKNEFVPYNNTTTTSNNFYNSQSMPKKPLSSIITTTTTAEESTESKLYYYSNANQLVTVSQEIFQTINEKNI